ncbi:MAG TPA: cytochrome d ubiquinol oxidase subunit II [Terriglobales bacterium]|jgi:cytochrome bd ubiquinol oxidase subunit II|nr:cytochrome d ubiquinol oxidase subunit II [Terriglobales bacterium]
MGFIWFWIVAVMIVAYVVFDGFDIGVGILHPFVARSEQERQISVRSIGPVWDGNEVWLIAGGGTLYFAFPLLYASAFSGFYLALMIVLWLLILRALGVELRMHLESHVWRAFFDGIFFISSLLLAIFYGAALANVIRGVPLGTDGYFFLPLWTNWRLGPSPGILDWYTVIGGVLALVALALHGALYLIVKTESQIQERSRLAAKYLCITLLALTIFSLPATITARPDGLQNYDHYPILYIVPGAIFAALIGILYFSRKQEDRKAFTCSCAYLTLMLVGAAVALYPRLLPSSNDSANDITIQKAISGMHTLQVGLIWWGLGMCIAVMYFVIIYRMFRGKVSLDSSGYGH